MSKAVTTKAAPLPAYLRAFPDLDMSAVAACEKIVGFGDGFADVSDEAGVDRPMFNCDVFDFRVDYTSPDRRIGYRAKQFVVWCEGETMLETDDFEDVRAFVKDGKRDF